MDSNQSGQGWLKLERAGQEEEQRRFMSLVGVKESDAQGCIEADDWLWDLLKESSSITCNISDNLLRHFVSSPVFFPLFQPWSF